LLQSCFWWKFLAAVLSPVAVTFTWRLLHLLAGFFVLDECYLLLCITLEGCVPLLLLLLIKSAATCCLRVPISVLRVP